jgi:glycerophosphoryl diester phosphodiesterase
VTREFLLRMHLHRKEVYAWTVNDIAKMSKLIRKGVDGIITDRPDFGLQARMAFE